MRKKLLSIIMALAMIATTMPMTAMAADGVATETELKTAIENANGTEDEPTTIKVAGTIELTSTLEIDGKHIVLQGGTISAGDSFLATSYSMIIMKNGASLKTEEITLDANEKARVLNVGGNSTLTVEDGTLITDGDPTGNNSGGGIYVTWGEPASVYIKGGKITNCKANKGTGGVYITNNENNIFEMTDGEISNNSNGGVKIYTAVSHAIMTGGKVVNNGSYGVDINNNNLVVGGDLEITGNDVDLHLHTEPYYFTIASALKNDIGIYTNHYLSDEKVIAKPKEGYTITESDLAHLKVGGTANNGTTLDYPLFLIGGEVKTSAVSTVVLEGEEIRIPVGQEYTLPTTGYTNGTYTLDGWAFTHASTEKVEKFTPDAAGETYRLNAIWVSECTWDANGGTFTDDSSKMTAKVAKGDGISKAVSYDGLVIPEVKERSGYQ